jgi:hypothetical protein
MTDIQIDAGEEFLSHFGVLGMHWGSHLPGRTEESHNHIPNHIDHIEARQLKRNPTSRLSNSDLQKINNRLQLETTYSQLKSKQGHLSKIKKGNETVKTLFAIGGSAATIYAFTKSPLGQKLIAKGINAISKTVAIY